MSILEVTGYNVVLKNNRKSHVEYQLSYKGPNIKKTFDARFSKLSTLHNTLCMNVPEVKLYDFPQKTSIFHSFDNNFLKQRKIAYKIKSIWTIFIMTFINMKMHIKLWKVLLKKIFIMIFLVIKN